MGSILAVLTVLVVMGIVSFWVMRRRTDDHETDSTQWIDSDFPDPHSHSHAQHSSDGDAATDSGGESSGDGGVSGSDAGGSGGD